MIADQRPQGDLINAAQRATAAMVGARVRDRRRELGLALAELADQLSLPASKLERIEAGEDRLGVSELGSLSALFGVPISWFFDVSAVAPAPAPEPAGTEPALGQLDGALPSNGNSGDTALAAEVITKFMLIHDRSLRRSILALLAEDEADEEA